MPNVGSPIFSISRSLAAGGVLAAFIFTAGCAWRVEPPREVARPAEVFLTQYEWHSRLALPVDDATMVEYGFGEWHFYGLEEQGWRSAGRAAMGLGTGAISRRLLPRVNSESEFLRISGGERTARLTVEREATEALRGRLDARWEAIRSEAVGRDWDDALVAPDYDSRYHLFHNSNHVAAGWLRELGCRVSGQPMRSNFRVGR